MELYVQFRNGVHMSMTAVTTTHQQVSNPGLSATARKLVVELIGTFFLVFTVGACARSGSSLARSPSARP